MVHCNEGGDSGTLQRGWRQWYIALIAMRVVTVVHCNEGGDSGTLQRGWRQWYVVTYVIPVHAMIKCPIKCYTLT